MDTQEAYTQLGLYPSATDAELKASWRRLVATWHPDRNGSADAPRRMQTINKAYQHLRQLRDGEGASVGGQAPHHDTHAAKAKPAAAETQSSSPHTTHQRKVRLTLEDAILGCTRTLRGHVCHSCSTCAGKGLRVLAQACSTCRGSGAVPKAALFGWMWSKEECADCGGDGRQRSSCDSCAGKGERAVAYRRQVRFPAGVRAGHVLSVPSAHHSGLEIGLELEVEIEPHAFFVLDGAGVLRCELPVNGYAWMANRWVEVPSPDGMQHMRLSRDALVYRLGGQGFPATPRGARGDYLVKIVPVFPEDDAASDALLDQLIDSSDRAATTATSHPLAKWQRDLKRWNASSKKGKSD